jgi:hypothetical protein
MNAFVCSGWLYAAGGITGPFRQEVKLSSVEKLNIASYDGLGQWESGTTLPVPLSAVQLAVVGSLPNTPSPVPTLRPTGDPTTAVPTDGPGSFDTLPIYVLGGQLQYAVSSVLLLDVAAGAGSWVPGPSMLDSRASFAAAPVAGACAQT